ncbi:MAG: RING finger protein, partial [Hydrogenoanaerobacterium sp.]
MEKYIGICCPVCNKPFTAEDDIAVCPQCGAPHHRSCFKELGRCAFTEQHAPGNEWKNPN